MFVRYAFFLRPVTFCVNFFQSFDDPGIHPSLAVLAYFVDLVVALNKIACSHVAHTFQFWMLLDFLIFANFLHFVDDIFSWFSVEAEGLEIFTNVLLFKLFLLLLVFLLLLLFVFFVIILFDFLYHESEAFFSVAETEGVDEPFSVEAKIN